MKKIIAGLFISLDGVVEAPDQWHFPYFNEEMGDAVSAGRFLYNSNYQKQASFMTSAAIAGDPIGFTLIWPNYHNGDAAYTAKDLPYTVTQWNGATQAWETAIDPLVTHKLSVEMPNCPQFLEFDSCHVAAASVGAPSAGVFRITVGYGGNLAYLLPVSYDVAADAPEGRTAQTYVGIGQGLTQAPSYFYIPKGTGSIDLDVGDGPDTKTLRIYTGLVTQNPGVPYREVDISGRGNHRVTLEPGEDGTIAMLSQNGFTFPYLHSIPQPWAMSPDELMVPRAIAQADGLTASA